MPIRYYCVLCIQVVNLTSPSGDVLSFRLALAKSVSWIIWECLDNDFFRQGLQQSRMPRHKKRRRKWEQINFHDP